MKLILSKEKEEMKLQMKLTEDPSEKPVDFNYITFINFLYDYKGKGLSIECTKEVSEEEKTKFDKIIKEIELIFSKDKKAKEKTD